MPDNRERAAYASRRNYLIKTDAIEKQGEMEINGSTLVAFKFDHQEIAGRPAIQKRSMVD